MVSKQTKCSNLASCSVLYALRILYWQGRSEIPRSTSPALHVTNILISPLPYLCHLVFSYPRSHAGLLVSGYLSTKLLYIHICHMVTWESGTYCSTVSLSVRWVFYNNKVGNSSIKNKIIFQNYFFYVLVEQKCLKSIALEGWLMRPREFLMLVTWRTWLFLFMLCHFEFWQLCPLVCWQQLTAAAAPAQWEILAFFGSLQNPDFIQILGLKKVDF